MSRISSLVGSVSILVLSVVACATPARAQSWTARETLRIGGIEDPAGTIFGSITAAIVDDSGRIHVADALSHDVRVFSPAGRLERTMGRRGRGPGEFETPATMGFLGRSLWVSDPVLRRVVFFDAAGRADSARGLTPALPPTFAPAGASAMAMDGSVILVPSVGGNTMVMADPPSLPVLRVNPSGRMDTLHLLDLRGIAVAVDLGGRQAFARQPLPTAPIHSIATDGGMFAVVEQTGGAGAPTSTFRLTVKDGQGRVLGQRAVPYTPVRVPAAWRDSVLKMYDPTGKPAEQQQIARRLSSALHFPSTFPPVDRVLVGTDRTVWVRLAGADAMARWLVFDARAAQVGALRLPAAMTVLGASRQRIIASGLNSDGEPVVVRYGVTATGR